MEHNLDDLLYNMEVIENTSSINDLLKQADNLMEAHDNLNSIKTTIEAHGITGTIGTLLSTSLDSDVVVGNEALVLEEISVSIENILTRIWEFIKSIFMKIVDGIKTFFKGIARIFKRTEKTLKTIKKFKNPVFKQDQFEIQIPAYAEAHGDINYDMYEYFTTAILGAIIKMNELINNKKWANTKVIPDFIKLVTMFADDPKRKKQLDRFNLASTLTYYNTEIKNDSFDATVLPNVTTATNMGPSRTVETAINDIEKGFLFTKKITSVLTKATRDIKSIKFSDIEIPTEEIKPTALVSHINSLIRFIEQDVLRMTKAIDYLSSMIIDKK